MSVHAVPVEGDPMWTQIAMLDNVAAEAHLPGELDGGTVTLACVIISDNCRYVMLQDGRSDETLVIPVMITKRDPVA